jgi:hypothetical protein
MRPGFIAAAAVAAALAGCQSTPPPTTAAPNRMLTDAGFVAKKATTSDQISVLATLPPNKLIKQTANGKTTYLYADPACNCVHVGSQSAFQNFKGMQNTVYEMNRAQTDPGIGMGNIGDLGSWEPF